MKCKNYIDGTENFVYLGKNNLSLIYKWATDNESIAICGRYVELCLALGGYINYIESCRNGYYKYMNQEFQIRDFLIQLRDTMGREILEQHIKHNGIKP